MSGPTIPPAGGPANTANAGASARGKPAVSAEDQALARDFEAVFLTQFVDEMMKTVDVSAAGGGHGAEMWRSFLSQAMADRLADNGGLGIGASITQMLAAYKR